MGSPTTKVDREFTMGSYINGAALVARYYEGDAKDIVDMIVKSQRSAPISQGISGQFALKRFSYTNPKGMQTDTQIFSTKNRLYVISAVAMGTNQAAKAFLDSVLVTTPQQAATGQIDMPTALPAEMLDPPAGSDSEAIPVDEADRAPLILQMAYPRFTEKMRRSWLGVSVKVRILLSASGHVTNAEIVNSPSILMNDAVIAAAKQIIFIPAEKNGKLVSVYLTTEYGFDIRFI
jgi:TonB family protein